MYPVLLYNQYIEICSYSGYLDNNFHLLLYASHYKGVGTVAADPPNFCGN